jgi:hypothetical protein
MADAPAETEPGDAAVTAAALQVQSRSLLLLSATSASMAAVASRMQSTSSTWSRQVERLQRLRSDLLSLTSGLRRLRTTIEQEHTRQEEAAGEAMSEQPQQL